mgnify:CR=1 FL=1
MSHYFRLCLTGSRVNLGLSPKEHITPARLDMMIIPIGIIVFSASATIGAAIVMVLQTKLHIPMLVTMKLKGNSSEWMTKMKALSN